MTQYKFQAILKSDSTGVQAFCNVRFQKRQKLPIMCYVFQFSKKLPKKICLVASSILRGFSYTGVQIYVITREYPLFGN